MNIEEWRKFLENYSAELLEDEIVAYEVPEEVHLSKWMGFSPASESQILAAEQRIGKSLPPSLRNFYSVTNGWRTTGLCIYDILPVEEIDWLQVCDDHLYELALDAENNNDEGWTNEKFRDDYRYEQGTRVKRSLVISSWGDAAVWLLDPEEKDAHGEWSAGRWASWNPAMEWLTASFAELMLQEFESFLEFRDSQYIP